MTNSNDWKKFDIAYQCENKPEQLTFKQWLETYPIVLELYGDLPESYLKYMYFQSSKK